MEKKKNALKEKVEELHKKKTRQENMYTKLTKEECGKGRGGNETLLDI